MIKLESMIKNEKFVGICPFCNKMEHFAEVVSTRFDYKVGRYTRRRSCVCLTCRAVIDFVNEPLNEHDSASPEIFIEKP